PPPSKLPCGGVTVACDSISASKGKCGQIQFGPVVAIPKYYLTQTETYTQFQPLSCRDDGFGNFTIDCSASVDATLTVVTQYTALPDCGFEVTFTPADSSFDFTDCRGHVVHSGIGAVCGLVFTSPTNYHCSGTTP